MTNKLKEKTLEELLESLDGIECSLDAATDAQELFFQSAVEQWETVNHLLENVIAIAQQSNFNLVYEINERVKEMGGVEALTHPHHLIRELKADQIEDERKLRTFLEEDGKLRKALSETPPL